LPAYSNRAPKKYRPRPPLESKPYVLKNRYDAFTGNKNLHNTREQTRGHHLGSPTDVRWT
jgi:hypothetical protein